MSNKTINEQKQKENFKIVQKVNSKIQAILQKYNCMLVPTLNIQGNQVRHLVNIVLKPKETGIVDKEGNKV